MSLNYLKLRLMKVRGEFDTHTGRKMPHPWARMAFVVAIIALMSIAMVSCVHAATGIVDVNKLANAIYMAEGGAKTRHPYGILAKYKTTTPRQACINTIKSNYKRWVKAGKRGDFIEYLGRTYCPIGAKKRPNRA